VAQVDGIRDGKSGAILGNIEAKYLLPKYGLTVTPAWSTNNVVRSTFELDNQIAKGPSVLIFLHPLVPLEVGVFKRIGGQVCNPVCTPVPSPTSSACVLLSPTKLSLCRYSSEATDLQCTGSFVHFGHGYRKGWVPRRW